MPEKLILKLEWARGQLYLRNVALQDPLTLNLQQNLCSMDVTDIRNQLI
jgi:hypothetical protein